MDEYTRLVRVRDDLFDDLVPARRIGTRNTIAERVPLDIFDLAEQVALFFVKEGFAVRDQELQVSDLWSINRRKVDFIQDAVRKCEPYPASRGVCGSHAFF
jgi:hypothetical protein